MNLRHRTISFVTRAVEYACCAYIGMAGVFFIVSVLDVITGGLTVFLRRFTQGAG